MHKEKKSKILRWSSLFLLLLVLLAVVLAVTLRRRATKGSSDSDHQATTAISKFITSACQHTLYPLTCESSLLGSALAEPESSQLLDLSFRVALDKVDQVHSLARNLSQDAQVSGRFPSSSALDDCVELLHDTTEQLTDSANRKNTAAKDDVRTWLSAALTNLDTCIDGINDLKLDPSTGDKMKPTTANLSHYISNSLALYEFFTPGPGRRLIGAGDDFPTWVNRKLLEAPVGQLKPDVVVAKDGTGACDTVGKAVAMAKGGEARFVIYVKEGVYRENVVVKRSQTNVLLVGDGKGKTIIVGSRSVGSGFTTFRSATFAVSGSGFVARDIAFVNDAGPESGQGVALQVSSDKSAIFRCSIVGQQDSLYAHTSRQFYRETDIHGTVDFIFGNAVAVFQNCDILPKKPLSGHKVTVTAQSRSDPNQNTGFTIQNCRVAPDPDSAPAKAFLGRPWKEYSRVVVMQSQLDGFVDPAGWMEWSGDFALKTLFYAEYMNSGGGAGTSGRVTWPGYHASLTEAEATKFTVGEFLAGTSWLPNTEVAFYPGLL
ncbi:pectinesterase-like [Nymphaea colorata]|nr:pectinesterase-like [Nymphaea colorata]